MTERERVFIGFGSNKGDRRENIHRALGAVADTGDITVVKLSSLYRTEPVGYNKQEDFYNGVAEVATVLSPRDLLLSLKDIESALGRTDIAVRWGPRIIDLDVLLFGSRVIRMDDLQIPHPRMHRRRFVLEPLAEIAPEVQHPCLAQSVKDMLLELIDDKKVIRIGEWTER